MYEKNVIGCADLNFKTHNMFMDFYSSHNYSAIINR